MTSSEPTAPETPPRRYRWRYGPMRLAMPVLAILGGIAGIVRGIGDVQSHGDPLFVYIGAGLIVLAIISIFISRWQAKRGY